MKVAKNIYNKKKNIQQHENYRFYFVASFLSTVVNFNINFTLQNILKITTRKYEPSKVLEENSIICNRKLNQIPSG